MAEPVSPAPLRVGYVPHDAPCWTFFRYHLLLQAKTAGVTIIDRPINTLREQVAEIDALLQQGIDVLLLRPLSFDDAGLIAALQRVQRARVPVIALDGAVGGDLSVSTVSVDNVGAQAAVTEYICQRLGGHGRIAYLQGNQDMDTGRLRKVGLYGVLARHPGVELAHEGQIDWAAPTPLRAQGAALARAVLDAHGPLDAIITVSDEAAFGVADALDERGLRGRVLVTGFDALPEALIAIEDGLMEASAYQPQQAMAERALYDAVRLAMHGETTVVHTRLPAEVIARHNVVDATVRALRLFPGMVAELEQQRRQEQRNTAFLEALIDNLPLQLVIMDAVERRIVRNSRAAEAWFGVERGGLLGKTLFDLLPQRLAQDVDAQDRELLQTGQSLSLVQEDPFRPDLGRRMLSLQKVPVFDVFGKAAFLLVIVEDISERQVAEDAAAERARELEASVAALENNREKLIATEKMAALGSLVAGIAHELSTPIGNGLLVATTLGERVREIAARFPGGLSRAMLDDYLAEALENARILEHNLRRAAQLINSFRQISVDQESTQRRRFGLSTLVAEVVLALSPMLRRTPFTLSQQVDADIVMDSYPGALEQVLINLVSNAVIHGLAGRASGRIVVTGRRVVVDDAAAGESVVAPVGPVQVVERVERVELVVEDDGRGIERDALARVFEPFYTTRGGEGGSGLGLSIVHNLVSGLLGGEVALTSTAGAGTRFCLTLPRVVKAR